MKIYTKRGDAGETGLFGGQRVSKDDLRVAAYGDVDELNALLGLARAADLDERLAKAVARVQDELFTLGAELATPDAEKNPKVPTVDAAWIERLEEEIDAIDGEVPPLRQFVLPGGSQGASWLHLARTVCRRAERSIVQLSRREPVGGLALAYVNRLSDWLFMAARAANHRAGVAEIAWTPPGDTGARRK